MISSSPPLASSSSSKSKSPVFWNHISAFRAFFSPTSSLERLWISGFSVSLSCSMISSSPPLASSSSSKPSSSSSSSLSASLSSSSPLSLPFASPLYHKPSPSNVPSSLLYFSCFGRGASSSSSSDS